MSNRRPEAHDPPLLITENRATFIRIYDSLLEDIDTQSAIEKLLISSMAQTRIEIERYDRAAAAVINMCIGPALADLLNELLRGEDEWPFEAEEDAQIIAARWFTDEDTKQKILRLLRKLNLDESAIVAKAMELAQPQLGLVQHLIHSAESRFYKALRALEDYRAGSLGRLRHPVAPTIEGQAIESAPRARLSGRR